jgi:hypothetical protein
MAAFTGSEALEERARVIFRALGPAMAQAPSGFGYLLGALDLATARAKEIAISTDDPASPGARALADVVWGRYLPNRVLAVGRTRETAVPLLKDRPTRDGRATAYVCERFVCGAPVTDPDDLAAQLVDR